MTEQQGAHHTGRWIAERVMEATLPDGTETTVIVRIGVPEARDDERLLWYTPTEIEGAGKLERHDYFGPGDSLSSLNFAIMHVGLQLQAYGEAGIKLTWIGGNDLGFPKPQ